MISVRKSQPFYRRDVAALLGGILFSLAFTGVILTPVLANYFGLFLIRPGVAMVLVVAIFLWVFALRTLWRTRAFDRFLGLGGDL